MTEALIVIAIVVVIVAVLLAVGTGGERKLEGRRAEAQELRETAQTRDERAELEHAEAERQAARPRTAQAEAEETAALADDDTRFHEAQRDGRGSAGVAGGRGRC